MISSLLVPGSVVGGEFTVVDPLSQGGMGAVYLVEQKSTGKQRALKVMHREIVADASLQKRFEQEARVGARIRSEHVVEVLAAGVDASSGVPYLVMELLEGEDLRHRIDRSGALSHTDVRAIFEQLCHAMAAAHAANVVHRDLKPENVFLARSRRAGTELFTVKVLDFGIAKLVAEAGTSATKGAMGSPLWMAPEQTVPGETIRPATDVWALGLMAYELLTGRNFWRTANDAGGTTVQLLREIVLDPIPPASARAEQQGVLARLPPAFDAWFGRCVARDPSARFADAGALWHAMPTLFQASQALAATFPATSGGALRSGAAMVTADATPFVADALATEATSEPPRAAVPSGRPFTAPHAETPIAMVHPPERAGPATTGAGRAAVLTGIAIAIAGVAIGWGLSRSGHDAAPGIATIEAGPALANAVAPIATPAVATAPSAVDATSPEVPPTVAAPAKPTSSPPRPVASTSAASLETPSAPKRPSAPGGFSDPSDRNGPVMWKVQERHVRLFTRLVTNESNVTDGVVKSAIEWNSWEYLRCYERAFKGAKDMPEGAVTVGFDVLDQLPRHAALVSSTISSASFNDCVVQTLLGQTINAAGPEGKGHAVHAFRFVPMD